MMKRGKKLALILIVVFILSTLLCNTAFAQQRPAIRIRVGDIGNVFKNTFYKWYETTETQVEVNGKVKTNYVFNDAYKTQRMIIDIIIFFMIFAGMIYFALHKWIGEHSKGALAVLTVGLGFGLSLALVTQTKYGSISVLFPFARNLIGLAFAMLLFYLLDQMIKNKFWSAILALLLTFLAFGMIPLLFCEPGDPCYVGGYFAKGYTDTKNQFMPCADLIKAIRTKVEKAEGLESTARTALEGGGRDYAKTYFQDMLATYESALKDIETLKKTRKDCDGEDVDLLKTRAQSGWNVTRQIMIDEGMLTEPGTPPKEPPKTEPPKQPPGGGGGGGSKGGVCTDKEIFAAYKLFAPKAKGSEAATAWQTFKNKCSGGANFAAYRVRAKEIYAGAN